MGMEIMKALTMDPLGKEIFEKFVKVTSVAYANNFDFVCKFMQIASAQWTYPYNLPIHTNNNKSTHFFQSTRLSSAALISP
jgi:hypothetical protein